jgi:hypothetical protein
MGVGSDRYAMVVVQVSASGKTLLIDWYDAVDGECGPAPFDPDKIAAYVAARQTAERAAKFGRAFRTFTLRTDGKYRQTGDTSGRGTGLSLGHAENYQDPSF